MKASTAYMLEKKEGIHPKTNTGGQNMERTRCEEIVLDSYAVGTTDIMDYADEHPNEYFDYTDVRSSKTNFGRLMVSDYEPSNIELECDRRGLTEWHDLYNGWQRTTSGFGWVCRKNGRYIFITD